jgi:3(or 17)beta-hydroxysteroid dehydrogenase
MKLKDKVAIVTGASAGIGKATAELFVKEGAKVVLTDIKEAEGQKVASEIGSEAIFIKHDVAKEEDWIHVVNTTIDKFG